MMQDVPRRMLVFAGLLLVSCLAGCGGDERDIPSVVNTPVALSNGTYRVAFGRGYPAADESKLLVVTATLDRTTRTLVFTMANGAQQRLAVSFRQQSEWQPACPYNNGLHLNEVADLSPAPLVMESMIFATAVVYPKCGPRRIILSAAPGDESYALALDLQ